MTRICLLRAVRAVRAVLPLLCRLEVAAPYEGEPELAAMLCYDEITRGDASLCKSATQLAWTLPACLPLVCSQ